MLSQRRESCCYILRLSIPPTPLLEFFHRYAPPQTGNMVLKQSGVSEKLSALEFQSILPLKCVQGAERK